MIIVLRIKSKALLTAVFIFLLLSGTGCVGSKNAQTLTVYPVLNDRAANSYIAADGGAAAVVDPSDPERIIPILTEKGLKLKFIILTHGHFDHILGVDSLASRFPDAKVLIHPLDSDKLSNPEKNLSFLSGTEVRALSKTSPITEKDIIEIGNTQIKIIETPGHSQGSIILLAGNSLFAGDTLFKGSIGRTDFPGSNYNDMTQSLKKIMSLDGDFTVYSGHGEITTLQEEKENNPYLK